MDGKEPVEKKTMKKAIKSSGCRSKVCKNESMESQVKQRDGL